MRHGDTHRRTARTGSRPRTPRGHARAARTRANAHSQRVRPWRTSTGAAVCGTHALDPRRTAISEQIPNESILSRTSALMRRDIFYEADASGTITYVSSGAERYGFDADALVGEELLSIVAPEHRERVAGEFARTLMTGDEFPSEVPLVDPEGRVHWFEDCAIVVRENGRAVAISGFLRDISARKTSAVHLDHLRAVLDAHRSIGKLVLRSTTPQRLVQGVVDELVRTRSYENAWIALVDGQGGVRTIAHALVDKDMEVLRKRIESGMPPDCWNEATTASGAIAIEDPTEFCRGCPIAGHHHGNGAMSVRIEYAGVTYGFLNVSIAPLFLSNHDETALLDEVADDIAYALHNMELAARKREAELALIESETRYQMLFEDSHDAVYVTSLDGRILEANQAMLALFGLTREEMIGADAHTFYANPDDRAGFQRAIERSGSVADYEIRLKRRSGEIMDCLLTTSVRRGADGSIVGYHGIIRDVTRQKQAERALFESERLYRTIFELSPEAIVLLDRRGTFLAANDRLTDWLGYTPDEVVGRRLLEMPFFTVKSKTIVIRKFLRRLSGRPVAPYDLDFVAKSGKRRIGRIVGTVVTDDAGRPEADIVMISDVTEQREAEVALRGSREKIEGLHGTARRLEACETEDEVCRVTVDAAKTVLGYPRCVVAQAADGELRLRMQCSETAAECAGGGDAVDSGPIHEAHARRTSVVFPAPGAAAPHPESVFGLACGICVPLGDEGVFCVGSEELCQYGDKDVRLLELLLGHTGESLRRIRLLARLREQATRDSMTGLYNRRYFTEAIGRDVERSRRHGRGIGFLMIDVNHFKAINDTHGHQVGDDVLRAVAGFLEQHVRASEMVVRFGGDEFLVVMPDIGDDTDAVKTRLAEAFEAWVASDDAPFDFELGIAIGGALWDPYGSASIQETIAAADERMYEDKRRQRVQDPRCLSDESGVSERPGA